MTPFIPGLELSRRFHAQAVAPVLARHWPRLAYSAALLGPGSEVLGFDTPQSMDHHWGPRLQLFLSEADLAAHGPQIEAMLARELPHEQDGISTHFGPPDAIGVRLLVTARSGPVQHMVSVQDLGRFWQQHTGVADGREPTLSDWLAVPQQTLLSLTSGAVFHDGLGRLEALRRQWQWYPAELWRYLMACQWTRIGQEEAFVGRCGDVGDELGSMVIAARLVRDLMRLCFLIERQYAPYAKWLGTAFARLRCGPELEPVLRRAMQASGWRERERQLAQAYAGVVQLHNALDLTPPLPPAVSPFHERPYLVIHGDRFAAALRTTLRDPEVLALAPGVGAVDQFVDSTDALCLGPVRLREVLAVHTASTPSPDP
jgi:hypothetical protein